MADNPKDYMSLSHKIRKPIVEKLRRDRINNCIEELKALLGPQLLNQQPETKLEKADILEMTVCLIRHHLQKEPLPSPGTVDLGSRGVQEDVRFESNSHDAVTHPFWTMTAFSSGNAQESALSQTRVLDQHTLSKENTSSRNSMWRPW
ncbi:transcription factor HES-5-like [Engraulis encrasicolus]|uniref:transcription factor HES-5-like n=1 Tax=Engraulis encrasicolus TaxID=184585 RepID=UPI002FD5F967